MDQKRIVATGLAAPEGPVLLPDGRIAFVEQMRGRVSVFDGSRVDIISESPGSPNAVTLGADGYLYAAQNGGVVGPWRSSPRAAPGIQRIGINGVVEYVATEVGGFATKAPNDLVFGPDGRLYFTDPAEPYDPIAKSEHGRLFVLDSRGGEMLLDVGFSYPNGLAFLPDGRLVWVETYEREVCVLEEGRRRVLCKLPENQLPDGLDVALDGRMFIATFASHGITVVSPNGKIVDFIYFDSDALPSNCCFHGRTLWVTDFGNGWAEKITTGRLWRVETDAEGKPQQPGRIGCGVE
jgi:gluconolactonase